MKTHGKGRCIGTYCWGIISSGETPDYEDTSANILCDTIIQVSFSFFMPTKIVCFMHVFSFRCLYANRRMSAVTDEGL